MKGGMTTESQFRERFRELNNDMYADYAAAAAAREAGLEFAPEPGRLPDRLEISGNEDYVMCRRKGDGELLFLAIISQSGRWDDTFAVAPFVRATWIEAVRRYNAWPALAAAIAELARQARAIAGLSLAGAIEAAEAALAEGQK